MPPLLSIAGIGASFFGFLATMTSASSAVRQSRPHPAAQRGHRRVTLHDVCGIGEATGRLRLPYSKFRTGAGVNSRAGLALAYATARSRVRGVEHHAALPYAELPAFLASLRKREAVSARALEFLIVTAGRTGEVIGAHWSEISLPDKTWTVRGSRA